MVRLLSRKETVDFFGLNCPTERCSRLVRSCEGALEDLGEPVWRQVDPPLHVIGRRTSSTMFKLVLPRFSTTTAQSSDNLQSTMASAVPKGQLAAASESPKPTPTVQAIATLDTTASKLLSSARPALLLALLAGRFHAFVEDPVSELQAGLVVLGVLQVTYAVVCLPAAGSQQAKPARKQRPGERKKHDSSGPNLIVVRRIIPGSHHKFSTLLDDTCY